MASTYSTSLKLELIGNGDQSGTWGTTTNTNLGTLLEQAITGVQAITMANVDYTLSNLNGVSDEARNAVLVVGGTNSAIKNIIAPAVNKTYIIVNNTSGGYAVNIKTSSSTGVNIPNGTTGIVYCNGTEFYTVTKGYDTANTANTLVLRDGSGNFAAGTITATSFSGPLTGAVTGDVTGNLTGNVTGNVTGNINGTVGATTPNTGVFTGLTASSVTSLGEVTTVSATAATGTINYDVSTQGVLYYTTNASANWTVNFRASSGTTLNALMAIGETRTVTFMVTQGSTAYYNSAVTVDGTSVTPKWQGGSAPTSGNASSIDIYTYSIIKTASATFTVLASQSQFK